MYLFKIPSTIFLYTKHYISKAYIYHLMALETNIISLKIKGITYKKVSVEV